MIKPLKFSYHAQLRILERNINEETVKFTIENPDYTIKRFGDEIEAFKKTNGKTLKVIYTEKARFIKIITLYWIL